MSPKCEFIVLPDGRRLAFSLYGSEDGFPVVYFHGFPGSRLEAVWADKIARQINVMLVALDRPGYGLSSPDPRGSLLGFGKDVMELTEILGFTSLSLLGVSGGGPYALGCAQVLGKRVCSLGLVGSIAPFEGKGYGELDPLNKMGLRIVRSTPSLAKLLVWTLSQAGRPIPQLLILMIALRISPKDRKVLLRTQLASLLCASFREGLVQKGKGMLKDAELYSSQWGNFLRELSSKVYIWHGTEDRLVPWKMAMILKDKLPNSELFLLEGEGHFSIFQRIGEEVLFRLLSDGH